MCIGNISAWLVHVGSRHNHTVLLGLGTVTKLLQYLPFTSTPSDSSIWWFCSFSSSFLNRSCSAYATHLSGTWYGFVSSWSWWEKSVFKAPYSCEYITLFIMHLECCFCTHHSVGFSAWACDKVVYYLFNFLLVVILFLTMCHFFFKVRLFLTLLSALDFSCFVC